MNTDSTLCLPMALVNGLLDTAGDAHEREICGFIIAEHDSRPCRWPIDNIATRVGDRFEMDPAGQIALFRHLREYAARLLAIYHSHPHGEAIPSTHDVAGHSYPAVPALIVAPGAAAAEQRLRAWWMPDTGSPVEVDITIADAFL